MGEGLQNGKSNGHAAKDGTPAKQSVIDAKGASKKQTPSERPAEIGGLVRKR